MIIVNERGEVINYEEAGDNSDDSEDEFEDLDDVGSAIERMLTDNSLEKFLISDSKPENCKWKVCNEDWKGAISGIIYGKDSKCSSMPEEGEV